ncbi:PLP-dependent aminotransferase family protein [Streptomyces sviceus]|uniref:aminotransferase-like domain-containing protein n=1 Tax=Streptomyces sviceus TaxID=285530 RepID=UPI0036AB20E4
MVRLSPSRLHDSLRSPALGSIGFLNEVMTRFPDAVSFAPGAPHPGLVADLDVQRCIDRFLDHLVHEEGHTPKQARLRLYEYGPSRGLINGLVGEALRRDLQIDAPSNALVITVGAQEGMLLALRALFRPSAGDVLAVANPCFVGITGAAGLLDIPVVGIDETETGIDLDGLTAACHRARADGRRIRACYVASDFSNPGGNRMSLECRRQLLELAEREDLLVLEDNTYGFTTAPGHELPSLKALDKDRRVIHIGTFAKVCFPGARVGYVVADQPVDGRGRLLADELAALKTVVTVNTSPLGQAVIGGMLLEHGGSLAELSRAKSELYQRNLNQLVDALDRTLTGRVPPGVEWTRPAGGFFVRMRLPVPADVELLEISAAEHGVLWTPMAQFYLDGTGDCQLRLSCSYLDPDQIETGVRRLANFLDKEIGQ